MHTLSHTHTHTFILLQGARPVVVSPPVFRCDYNVYSTFQSHEPEFDYLKSLEIEEKINQICWVKQSGSSLFLLTTNGKSHSLARTHTHTHTHMHTYTHIHTLTHTHIHTHSLAPGSPIFSMHASGKGGGL